jgi:hypothetical protein
MSTPFSITLFATTGDPQGIRHVDKSNWSGFGVVFSKEQVSLLKNEPGFNQAGIYILVGNAAEETIYIGEGYPLGNRLKTHVVNKDGWVWGVYFVDRLNKIGKTEVQFLESELRMAKRCGRAVLMNKRKPTVPNMSPVSKAIANAFLADMLLLYPMLGINAFNPPRACEEPAAAVQANGDAHFDTLVVPEGHECFQLTFIGPARFWYAIRLNTKHILKLQFIATYRVAPIGAITQIAQIKDIEPYGDAGTYLLRFDGQAIAIGPIPQPEGSAVSMQSPRYALLSKLLTAKTLDAVWG